MTSRCSRRAPRDFIHLNLLLFLHFFQPCKEFIGAVRAHVGQSCPCSHQPLAEWAMIKQQLTVFCLYLLPWLAPLREQERAPKTKKPKSPEHQLKLREARADPPRAGGFACLISCRVHSRDRGAVETTPAHQPLRASLTPCLCIFFCLREEPALT